MLCLCKPAKKVWIKINNDKMDLVLSKPRPFCRQNWVVLPPPPPPPPPKRIALATLLCETLKAKDRQNNTRIKLWKDICGPWVTSKGSFGQVFSLLANLLNIYCCFTCGFSVESNTVRKRTRKYLPKHRSNSLIHFAKCIRSNPKTMTI